MSYMAKINNTLGINRALSRVPSNVIGAMPTSLQELVNKAKANAPHDVSGGTVTAVAGAAAGAVIGYRREHPVLGAISGFSLGRNAPALLRPIERKAAIHNLVVTHAGVFGSVALKGIPPWLGFVAGYVAAEIGTHLAGV